MSIVSSKQCFKCFCLVNLFSFCLFSQDLIQTEEIPHQISFTVVEGGGNVTLRCPFFEKEGKFFQWYKLPLGYMVQTVATGTYNQQTLSEPFNNLRFKVTEREAHYALTITNVSKDDEATYFCQTGTAYSQRFVDTVHLAVNGKNFLFSLMFLCYTNNLICNLLLMFSLITQIVISRNVST